MYQNTLYNRLWSRFGDLPGAVDEIERIRGHLDELKHLPQGWYDGVLRSFMEALRRVWWMMILWAVLAIFGILPLKQHQLHSKLTRR